MGKKLIQCIASCLIIFQLSQILTTESAFIIVMNLILILINISTLKRVKDW